MSDIDPLKDLDFENVDLDALEKLNLTEEQWQYVLDHIPPSPEELDLHTNLYSNRINSALENLAGEKYSQIILEIFSSSAQNTLQLEEQLNARVQKLFPGKTHLVVLDPDLYAVGVFFGMTGRNISKSLLRKRGYDPDSMDLHTEYMPFHDKAPLKDGGNVYYLLPAGDYYVHDSGFPRNQAATYQTFHEFYHFFDPVFAPAGADSFIYAPKSRELIDKPEDLQNLLITLQAEMFADFGALSDMIREGDDLDIIDTLVSYRLKSDDIGHCTVLGLEAFKRSILNLGVEKFRTLSDEQTLEFCINVVKNSSPTTNQLYIAAKMHENELITSPISGADIAAGLFYSNYLEIREDQRNSRLDFKETPETVETKTSLVKRAFEMKGEVTPESVAIAYIEKLEELRNSQATEAEIDKLAKIVFMPIHYVAENLARNVNIFDRFPADNRPDKKYFDPKYLPAVRL